MRAKPHIACLYVGARFDYYTIPPATQAKPHKTLGAIHSTKIPTGPTGKSGPPQKVGQFFRNFSGWTEPIHWVLDRNFRKFWLNGSRPRRPLFHGNERALRSGAQCPLNAVISFSHIPLHTWSVYINPDLSIPCWCCGEEEADLFS